MPTGKAFIKFSDPSLTDYLIITWAEFASPLAEIGRQVYAAPHPERSLTVIDLNPVMHQFVFWSSTDGSTLDTQLITLEIDCGSVNTSRTIYSYVVDRGNSGTAPNWADPVDGATTLPVDERWKGAAAEDMFVEKRAFGKLMDSEYTKDMTNGQFSLVGFTFNSGEVWFVIVEDLHTSASSPSTPSTGSSDYMDAVVITGNTSFASSHYRKEIQADTTATIAILSFDDFGLIPKTKVLITTHNMTGRYLKLAFSGSNTVRHPILGTMVTQLYLRKGMECELVIGGGSGRVLRYEGDGRRVGRFEWGRGIEQNMIQLDGSQYDVDVDVPGLYEEYISQLPAGQVKDFTTWAQSMTITNSNGDTETIYPYKGFFAWDAGTRKIKVPDMMSYPMAIRAIKSGGNTADSSRIGTNNNYPGAFQNDNIRRGSEEGFVKKTGANTIASNVDSNTTPGRQFSLIDYYDPPGDGSDTSVKNHGYIPQIFV